MIYSNFIGVYCCTFMILITLGVKSNAYSFKCLDDCDCDTEDSAIHCHSGGRDRLQLPRVRLRGFDVVGLTHNNLQVLPSEDLLLEKFPDLKAVDVEGNPDFDCSTLDQYKQITIFSDCGKTPEQLAQEKEKLPTPVTPSEDCDAKCEAEKRARQLHEYILRLWEMLKAKLQQLSKKHGLDKMVEDVKRFFDEDVSGFFSDMGKKIKNYV